MKIRELEIEGCWQITSNVYEDERGSFREWFSLKEVFEETKFKFETVQSNISKSKKGALRGLHYSLAAAGQSKIITCANGSIVDIVVDIRPTSKTYKKWISTNLSGSDSRSLLVSSGLAHGFISLEEGTVVTYQQTSKFSPTEEFGINPFDPELGITWPDLSPILSNKDILNVNISEAERLGILPL
jgi:dTDP-4-dehydrorhamnose 3,5-epimerase